MRAKNIVTHAKGVSYWFLVLTAAGCSLAAAAPWLGAEELAPGLQPSPATLKQKLRLFQDYAERWREVQHLMEEFEPLMNEGKPYE